jgi:hypothetical protein
MGTLNLFDATESVLGYFYQCRYALLLFIERGRSNPSIEMSLERFDDVAFEEKGTPKELIQTKHHIGQVRNLTDASSDLWKTLRVWSESVISGVIDLSDVVLVIVTTATAPDGSIASLLRHKDRDTTSALQRLMEVTNTSKSQDNEPAYKAFCKLTHSQQQALLDVVYIYDNSPDIEDVLPEIKSQLALSTEWKHVDKLVSALEGWWFDTVVRHLKSQGDDTISGQALHTKIDDLREQYKRDSLPLDFCFTEPPNQPEPNKDQRTFVKQLRVIKSNEVTISKAICDQYKSFGQRSKWIRENLLLLDEWERYEHKLKDEWERHFAWAAEDLGTEPSSQNEEEAGRQLYRDIQDLAIYIRPTCTEPVIMRGSYQDLAEDLSVGWHPRYRELLESEGQK